MLARLPDGMVLVEDSGVVEVPRGEFGGLDPADQALSRAQEWQPDDDMTLQCVSLSPSTITNNGLDHCADLRMVERYRLDAEGGRLLATQWFSDPAMIRNDGAR